MSKVQNRFIGVKVMSYNHARPLSKVQNRFIGVKVVSYNRTRPRCDSQHDSTIHHLENFYRCGMGHFLQSMFIDTHDHIPTSAQLNGRLVYKHGKIFQTIKANETFSINQTNCSNLDFFPLHKIKQNFTSFELTQTSSPKHFSAEMICSGI